MQVIAMDESDTLFCKGEGGVCWVRGIRLCLQIDNGYVCFFEQVMFFVTKVELRRPLFQRLMILLLSKAASFIF